jgi:hypothetical protein
MKPVCLLAVLPLLLLYPAPALTADHDVVVYGGTSAGVIAAVQARRMGKSAVIVCPDRHLGGLSSGGLGFTDTGNKAVIGAGPRVLPSSVEALQRADGLESAEARGVRQQGPGHARDRWRAEDHVDL